MSNILNHASDEYSIIEDDVVHIVYTDMMLKLDPRYFSIHAYSCFEQYFININRQHGLLTRCEFDELEVKDVNLLGAHALWEIILQSRDESVFRNSMILLKKVYQGVKQISIETQEEFLGACMLNIKTGAKAVQEGFNPDAVSRISRALIMIRDFVQEFENAVPETAYKGYPIEIKAKNTIPHGSEVNPVNPVNLTIYSEMTILELKKFIYSKLELTIPFETVQMLTKGKYLDSKQYSKTASDFKIENDLLILVAQDFEYESFMDEEFPMPIPDELHPNKQSMLSDLKNVFDYKEDLLILALEKSGWVISEAAEVLIDPSQKERLEKQLHDSKKSLSTVKIAFKLSEMIANTKEYFNLLFELLELGIPSISLEIWNLLSQIPVNQDMHDELKCLGLADNAIHPDWNNLLDPNCLYKLHYSLQITNSFLTAAGNREWKTRFLELGGFSHLYKILMNNHLFTDHSKCFSSLLSIVKLFIQAALLSEPSEDIQTVFSPEVSPLKGLRTPENGSERGSEDLPELISQMSGGISEKIIGEIDFHGLMGKLLEILGVSITNCENVNSLSLVESALQLLLPILVYRPALLTDIFSDGSLAILVDALLECPKEEIRELIKLTLHTIGSKITHLPAEMNPPKSVLLEMLLSRVPEDWNIYCDQFFDLLNIIIPLTGFSGKNLLRRSIEIVINREIVEERNIGNQDNVLKGNINLMNTLLKLATEVDHDLLELTSTLYNMLFEIPEIARSSTANVPPVCKHPQTRQSAYTLLLTLVTDSPVNAKFVLEKLYNNHSDARFQGFFDADLSLKNKTGYVGLRNFGSTCYMNSLLQQFFMMPEFKDQTLRTPVAEQDLNENLLYQLQLVLCNLQESEKQYYAPIGLCLAFKGYDGEPMNVHMQQDVDEFFNLLCDKLEDLMKYTENAHLLRNSFGGSLVHEICSMESEFPYRSETEEHFMRISLDIKNKKTLNEALDLFIKEDLLEGENKYHCGQYDKKIDVKKRCLIGSLSNTLFIHLKRFEFDFNTMQRHKINDYCEFPMALNMKPWSKDGLLGYNEHPNSYYEYELVGVLVHSGIADAGHYYSFIADRETRNWFRFDDRHIDEFNVENLKEECFGGEGSFHWGYNQVFAKTKNAYMLVYERVKKFSQEDNLESVEIEANYEAKSEEIRQRVWNENMEFIRDLMFFDSGYIEFVKEFIRIYHFEACYDASPELHLSETFIFSREFTRYFKEDTIRQTMPLQILKDEKEFQNCIETANSLISKLKEEEEECDGFKLIKLTTLFSYEILLKTSNIASFCSWTSTLTNLYATNIPACLWLIKYLVNNKKLLTEILLDHKELEVRRTYSSFLNSLLGYTTAYEEARLFEYTEHFRINSISHYHFIEHLSHEQLFEKMMTSATARFIKFFIQELLIEARKNWRRFDEFFSVLKNFILSGPSQCRLVIELDGISRLLSFYMNGDEPFAGEGVVMGDPVSDPNMEIVLELLGTLIPCTAKESLIKSEDSEMPKLDMKTELDLQDYRVLRNLLKNIRFESVTRITLHLMQNDQYFSEKYIEELLSTILTFKMQWNETNRYLKSLAEILKLQDGLEPARAEMLFKIPMMRGMIYGGNNTFFDLVCRSKDLHSMFTAVMILWLGDMINIEHIQQAGAKFHNKLRWIPPHIKFLSMRSLPNDMLCDYSGRIRNVNEELKLLSHRFEGLWMSENDSSSEEMGSSAGDQVGDEEWKEPEVDNAELDPTESETGSVNDNMK